MNSSIGNLDGERDSQAGDDINDYTTGKKMTFGGKKASFLSHTKPPNKFDKRFQIEVQGINHREYLGSPTRPGQMQ